MKITSLPPLFTLCAGLLLSGWSSTSALAEPTPSEQFETETGKPAHWNEYLDIQYADLHPTNPVKDLNLVSLDIYVPKNLAPDAIVPVVVMVHGGGWHAGDKRDREVIGYKVPYFTKHGFAFVSVNYQLSPAIRHPIHAQDIALALAWVHNNAAAYQIDPWNMTLMGHSAGAHLSALVSTDDTYLAEAACSNKIITRVVLLDGVYDLIYRLRNDNEDNEALIIEAFGINGDTLRQASPLKQVVPLKRRYTPDMLIFFQGVPAKLWEDKAMIKTLVENGIETGGIYADGYTHDEVNEEVGMPGSAMNKPILDFVNGKDPSSLSGKITQNE